MEKTLLDLVHQLGQHLDAAYEKRAPGNDVTLRQLAVLRATREWDGVSQKALVEKTGIDRSTLADVLKRLKAKGLVSKHRNKHDARAYVVRCTTEGARIIIKYQPAAIAVEHAALQALQRAEVEPFLKMLTCTIEHLEKAANE